MCSVSGRDRTERGQQLLSGGAQAVADRSHFVLTQLLFWLLAAPDGHAKNFSIQHSVGGRYRLNSIHTRHWFELARAVGIEGLWDRMIDTVERSPAVISALENKLPKDFPESVYVAIRKGIERHAKEFLDGVEHVET